ncbi:MAG: RagB/SusD family nutrient uptake outer membrane protein [Bacteroidales bacterium]|nr:RagB/SusD family nutrient uptake outer membrane protein [Candidatus Cryptobacteroides aphodequi]
MKKYIIAILAALPALASCNDLLFLESETAVTNNYLYSSKDALARASLALYVVERDNALDADTGNDQTDQGIPYLMKMLDGGTDICLFRAGAGAPIWRDYSYIADQPTIDFFWKYHYKLIGRANEIITAAESIGTDDSDVATIKAEACLTRARAYFDLWKFFERLYLNTEPTTVDNLNRTYTPASREELFTQMKKDLDYAVDNLPWSLPTASSGVMYGRYNKNVALHVRAQVAMWEDDWDEAIACCERIFTDGAAYNSLETDIDRVFRADGGELRSKEILFSYQFSKNLGGGGDVLSSGNIRGHAINVYVTPQHRSIFGNCYAEEGGYGFGRIFPNSYLLSLYDQTCDKRYNSYFKHEYTYQDPSSANYGTVIDPKALYDAGKLDADNVVRYTHSMCIKQADFWTNQDLPTRQSSFRDLVVYRLAETYLMCAEAYFHKGDNTNALKYFNKTYMRAGNPEFTGTLTLDDLLDEYARECSFEGVRWPLLKRLGILGERVRLHLGDSQDDDPLLKYVRANCDNFTAGRRNFKDGKHEKWPIPSNQLLLMGKENFPQNEGWE